MKAITRIAVLALGLCATGVAMAAAPFGELIFRDQEVTVGTTEVVDVWAKFTLDANSPALVFSSNPLTGLDWADLPTHGQYYDPTTQQHILADFARIDSAYLSASFGGEGAIFTNGADPSTYTFHHWLTSQPGKPSIHSRESLSLQPGESIEYVVGQFVPNNGAASPGTYQVFVTGLFLSFGGVDVNGNELYSDGPLVQNSILLGATCPGGNTDECAPFTLTVTVPEPATHILTGVGLAIVGWALRRRESRSRAKQTSRGTLRLRHC